MKNPLTLVIFTLSTCLNFGVVHAQMTVADRLAPDQQGAVMAHRSAVIGDAPENSLAWIEGAIEAGVDMVHINPQQTADDEYILMHDLTLNRMTDVEAVFPHGPPNGPTREQRGGKDYVRDYTLAEIKQLRLRSNARDLDQPVPTLQEALDLVGGRILVVLGLKNYDVPSLLRALEGHQTQNVLLWELYYSGTDQSKLKEMAETSNIDVTVVLYRSRDYLSDLELIYQQIGSRLKMVSVQSARLTPEFLDRIDELGIRVMISGFSGPEDSALVNRSDSTPWKEALELGFAASTDQPEMLLEALGR